MNKLFRRIKKFWWISFFWTAKTVLFFVSVFLITNEVVKPRSLFFSFVQYHSPSKPLVRKTILTLHTLGGEGEEWGKSRSNTHTYYLREEKRRERQDTLGERSIPTTKTVSLCVRRFPFLLMVQRARKTRRERQREKWRSIQTCKMLSNMTN